MAAPTDTAPGNNNTGTALPELTEHSQTIGRYTIRFHVASGGMASVYLAIFRAGSRFEKWVALKVVHPHLAAERGFIDMFLDEARIVSRLNHPNVCTVFDSGETGGRYYLAMEYLHGATLADLVREAVMKNRMNLDAMARIVADAARGLHAAHELRDSMDRPLELIHRDVSPQNIFVLADGVAKVLDFGIARSRDRLGPETEAGQVKGKLAYMSPEQLSQKTVDRRADVFALGVVLWEATLGRRLFRRDSPAHTIAAIRECKVPAPHTIDPSYPPALEAIVMRALCRESSDRYQTADLMARDADAFVSSRTAVRGPSDVADYTRALFGQELDERMALLRTTAANTATEIKAPPADEFEAATVVDGRQDWASDATTTAATTRPRRAPPPMEVVANAAPAAAIPSAAPRIAPAIGPPPLPMPPPRGGSAEVTTLYERNRTTVLAALVALGVLALVSALVGALLAK